MSSPCISGGGRTYGFDLEIVKSSSTSSTRTSHTSSPSSTLSESSNSPLAISTRKPRTPRKRPNQTYNEAAALLSTAYPNIFSTKHLTKSSKFTKPRDNSLLLDQSSDLLLPYRTSPLARAAGKLISTGIQWSCAMGLDEDFDAESILDEEFEEGIDSIMGHLSVGNERVDDVPDAISSRFGGQMNSWYGNSMGYNFGGKSQYGHGIAMRRGVTALRHVDEGNWWNFPIVDMLQISPRLAAAATANSNSGPECNSIPKPKLKVKSNSSGEKKKKKMEKVERPEEKSVKLTEENPIRENSISQSSQGLILKLNYDHVLSEWSDRGSPFSDESMGCSEGNDVSARLAQIDLFSENGMREASVLRYKEKRRTRLFSKKIRYQVRKLNADQRPRMKGRFVRRPDPSTRGDEQEKKKKTTTFKL
ncbi:hypothetical protein OIU85_016157 [Salix viminalis]|uniref:CCT domain-containing protein n=1 Tax=Salix viminalis TaxID=40686 RepID=A0A9Q0V4L4_SALVM|nr:hypothetical protein OIU85_016157 [Salix viminalis]